MVDCRAHVPLSAEELDFLGTLLCAFMQAYKEEPDEQAEPEVALIEDLLPRLGLARAMLVVTEHAELN